jgi:hypothetical protein
MQYLVKEYVPGEEIKITMHIVTDEGDETNGETLWSWMHRAARRGASIAVYRVGPKTYGMGKVGPLDQFLVIDGRSDTRELSILWPSEAKAFIEMQERGESVTVCPTECVLDLS